MSPELEKRIAAVALDRQSGASEILAEVIAILRDALAAAADIDTVARAVVRAQPAMAPVWNAAIAAVATRERPDWFERFVQRVRRAPAALARFGVECFSVGRGSDHPLSIATISYSRSVLHVLEALAKDLTLQVACSESRPGLEGRTLASRLAPLGVGVTCFSDAAIGHGLGAADAVLIGADAIAPDFFINKSGTRMLLAEAGQRGVPAYIVASRDKFVSSVLAERLELREGAAREVWEDAPDSITVRNPYFEPSPLDLVTGLITDMGIVGVGSVPDICAAEVTALPPSLWDPL